MQNAKNMTEILKFVYVMFLFISLFIVTTEVGGKSFFHPFQFSFFSLYFVLNILSCFSKYCCIIFFITTGECINDIDCPQTGNLFYVFICKDRICELVNKYP